MHRRKFVALAGLTAVGGTGIYLTSDDAGAQTEASLGDLAVPDVNTVTNGDEVTDLTLSVDSSWSYDSSHIPDEWELTLLIGDAPTTMEPLDSVSESEGLLTSDSGTATLSGSVVSTWHFALEDFNPSKGNSVSHTVYVGLRFEVRANGEAIASAELTEPVTVGVDGAELDASAQVGGEGEISVEMGE